MQCQNHFYRPSLYCRDLLECKQVKGYGKVLKAENSKLISHAIVHKLDYWSCLLCNPYAVKDGWKI